MLLSKPIASLGWLSSSLSQMIHKLRSLEWLVIVAGMIDTLSATSLVASAGALKGVADGT